MEQHCMSTKREAALLPAGGQNMALAATHCTLARRANLYGLLVSVVIIMLFILPLQPAIAAPTQAPDRIEPLTVGVILGTAFLAKQLLGGLIDKASAAAQDTLRETERILDETIEKLRKNYQEALDVTLDQLDEFSRTQLAQIHGLVTDIIIQLELALKGLNEQILQTIEATSLELEKRLSQVQDLAVVVLRGTVLMLDKATFNLAFIVDLIILALGLIVFIILLFLRKIPTEARSRNLALGGIVLFLAIFGFLLLPQGRAFALASAGFGEQLRALEEPDIFQVRPNTVILSETKEVFLVGSRFAPQGQPPSVEVAGVNAPIVASDELVAVQVGGLDLSSHLGRQTISLRTADGQVTTALIQILAAPPPLPDLVITSFEIDPASPVEDRNAQARIVISNQGAGPALSFRVHWQPTAALPAEVSEVSSGLKAGESRDVLLNFAYITAGSFDTITIVDPFNEVDETNELNNLLSKAITVQDDATSVPPRPTPTVQSCTKMCRENDARCRRGELSIPRSECTELLDSCLTDCSE